MLIKLDPKQKEYVLKMAYLKTLDMSEMSAEEIMSVGDVSVEASELGLEISGDIDAFWSKFGSVVSEIGSKFQDVATKVISSSLIGILL